MTQETPQKDPREAGLIESEPALEAAYAEKPFKDALFEYKEQLSPEGKQALEWLASKKAEEAIAKYQEDEKENPVVRILRERALETLELPKSVREITAGKAWKGRLDKDWAARCKYGIEEFGKGLIENILEDPHMDTAQKISALKYLGSDLGKGIDHFVHGEIISKIDKGTEILWGYLIASLMNTDTETRRDLPLAEIERWEETPIGILVQKHFGFFERARKSYPEIGKKLDPVMEQFNWLWDQKQNRYISIDK